jgi:hypothetical protein
MISTLDTHESVKSLTAAGFTDAQAEALTAVVKRASDLDLSNIATKTDLANVELRLIKWVIGVGVGAVVALTGVIWAAAQVFLRALPHS